MLRYGLINELGTSVNLGFARVFFDEIGIKSGWLSLPTSGTKGVKSWVTFPVNTQVAVLMHRDGEQGEIIGSTWSETDAPPSFANEHTRGIEFPDGTIIFYDWNTKKLTVKGCDLEISGDIKVNGTIEANEVSAMGISLTKHTHTSGQSGTPTSKAMP